MDIPAFAGKDRKSCPRRSRQLTKYAGGVRATCHEEAGVMPAVDPTFYRSPAAAASAAPEQLAYVAAFDPTGRAKDALAVLDCDADSSTYGGVVGWAEMPTAGNELHHFGWSACSSALCHEGHGHHEAIERRYLLVLRYPLVEHLCPRPQTGP